MCIFRKFAKTRALPKDRRATTTLEFALIGPLALSLFIGFLLMSIFQFWQLALDDALRNAARQVETGKITTGAAFSTAVCAELGAAAPCSTSNLSYEVQTAATFGALTPATVSSTTGVLSTSGGFPTITNPANSGLAGGQPLLFQVTYKPSLLLLPLLPHVMMTGNPSPSLVAAVTLMAY